MPVVRMLTDDEMKQAVRLSDATFRDEEQPSMGEAFPYIFSPSAYHVSFGAFEEGKLLSFMGLVPWHIRIGEARLRVFSLGSVCTHPDARGRGIASEVLEEVISYIRRAGASLLLVSGARSLYRRAGCALFGRVRRYRMDRQTADVLLARLPSSPLHIREMQPSDLYELHDRAAERTVGYEHGVKELAALIKSEALPSCIRMSHRVLVAEQEGRVTAFAVIAVSKDLQKPALVMEYAGDPEAVVRLAVHAMKRFDLARLEFPVAWQEKDLHDTLAGAEFLEEDNEGTVMVVDGGQLIAQLRPWLERKDAETAAQLLLDQTADGNWRIQTGAEHLKLTPTQLACLLFDQATAAEPLPDGTSSALRALFPVPLPFAAGLAYI